MTTLTTSSIRRLAGLYLIVAISVSVWFRRRAAESGGEPGARPVQAVRAGLALVLVGWVGQLLSGRGGTEEPVGRLELVGSILAGGVLPVFYWTFRTLDRNVTGTAVVREEATLVRSGPYRFVRHPLYTTALVFWTGLVLMLRAWMLAPVVVLAALLVARRTPAEEANLREVFGPTYDEYVARTGRYLPRLRGARQTDLSDRN